MDTRTCPSCGEEVPINATRCKSCFQDLGPARKGPPWAILTVALVAVLLCIGAGVMWYIIRYQSVKENVVIDQETHSVVWTRTSSDNVETERLAFNDVKNVEVVFGGTQAVWEVYLNTKTGDRKLIHSSGEQPLMDYAIHVAAVMEKELIKTKNAREWGATLDNKGNPLIEGATSPGEATPPSGP